MMLTHKTVLLLSFFIFSNTAYALGLGELTVYSRLNEPLKAHIQLINPHTIMLDEVLIRNASKNTYNKLNLPKPAAFNEVRFKIKKISATSTVIELSSKKAIREPFITFVADLLWSEGHISKEYTFLLDPPEYIRKSAYSKRNKTAIPLKTKTAATIKTPSLPLRSTQTGSKTGITNATAGAQNKAKTYTIQPGDTLWKIARQFRPEKSVTVQQTLQAIFTNNSDAFINGNKDLMKANARLNIPSMAEILTINGQLASDIPKPVNVQQKITRQTLKKSQADKKKSTSKVALKKNDQDIRQDDARLTILPADKSTAPDSASRLEELALIHRALKTSLTSIQSLQAENSLLQEKISALTEKIKQMDERYDEQLNNQQARMNEAEEPVGGNSISESNSSNHFSSSKIEKQSSPLTVVKMSESSSSTVKLNSDLAAIPKQSSHTLIGKFLSNPLIALILVLFSLLVLFLGLGFFRKQKNNNILPEQAFETAADKNEFKHSSSSEPENVIPQDNEDMNFLEYFEKHIHTSGEEDTVKSSQPGREPPSVNEIVLTETFQPGFNTNVDQREAAEDPIHSNNSDFHYKLDLPDLNDENKEGYQQLSDKELFSEINTFMAYGSFETAEKMLNYKIAANPDNPVYIMKLFECYTMADKRHEFIQLAKNSSQLLNSDMVYKTQIKKMYEETWKGILTFN